MVPACAVFRRRTLFGSLRHSRASAVRRTTARSAPEAGRFGWRFRLSPGEFQAKRRFEGPVDFENRRFTQSTDFTGARFAEAPGFHGCMLHQDTTFPPMENFRGRRGEAAAQAYRTLKLAMGQRRATSEEAMFWALEQIAARSTLDPLHRLRDIAPWLLSWAYEMASFYGLSVSRPLVLFLLSTLIAFPVYVYQPMHEFAVSGRASNGISLREITDAESFSMRQVTTALRNLEPLRHRCAAIALSRRQAARCRHQAETDLLLDQDDGDSAIDPQPCARRPVPARRPPPLPYGVTAPHTPSWPGADPAILFAQPGRLKRIRGSSPRMTRNAWQGSHTQPTPNLVMAGLDPVILFAQPSRLKRIRGSSPRMTRSVWHGSHTQPTPTLVMAGLDPAILFLAMCIFPLTKPVCSCNVPPPSPIT